jgi:serine/threonine protein kinase
MTLKHEHIIELIEWFESKNHYFLVFELAAGGELFDHLIESPNCRSVPLFSSHKPRVLFGAPPNEPSTKGD